MNNETPNVVVPTLSSSTMLIELNISQWAGRKMDKKASKAVTATNGADDKAAVVHKSLLGNCPELKAIHQLTGNARNHIHYHYSTPWLDCGVRVITTKAMFEYWPIITAVQHEFYRLVDIFIDNYVWAVSQAELSLAHLFDAADYPSAESLREKFEFKINRIPMPDSGDFRLDIANDANAEMNNEYDTFYKTKTEAAMSDVWTRLYDKVAALSERLDYGKDDVKKVFKEGTVNGLLDIVDVLEMLNVTNDPTMTQMKQDLELAMKGVTPEALRSDHVLRAATKKKMDEAIAALPSLM